ncbi:MAG: hypothetical protein IJU79_02290 [Desulfovibrionaceae bacterium]|nr:hypothetical protein [Desulfovibrionaceae bacterium]
MPVHMDFINSFLNRDGVEGPQQTRGYIPCRPGNFYGKPTQDPNKYTAIGVSGVTIATGVDLGQTDVPSLQGYGICQATIDKLVPYIGLKTSRAIHKLSKLPLTITKVEADELDSCLHLGYLNRYVRPAYDRESKIKFDDLPQEAQAAIFSICYQKGVGGTRKGAPKTWRYFVNQQWEDACRELIHGFNAYAARRRLEGLLLKDLKN